MSETAGTFDRRFHRSSDRSVLGGVCGGLADYFGFNLKVTRVLAVIGFLMNPPLATLAYIAVVVLIPARSTAPPEPRLEPAFRQSTHSSTAQTMSDIRRRSESLDRRLAKLEKYVTSSRYQLDSEFRDLEKE